MTFACSSRSFAPALGAGRLSHLEWLDVCANELEVDAVALALADFPRLDDEYLAQIKKTAADLGLAVAAIEADALWDDAEAAFAVALRLGAPLAVARAAAEATDAEALARFIAAARRAARAAKTANVTVALRPAPATLCPSGTELKGLLKDVDGAWLRAAFDADGPLGTPLDRSVIAYHALGQDDAAAATALARFRGAVVLEAETETAPHDYHAGLAAFRAARERTLASA